MYYIMNIGFWPVVGRLVVGEAGGSAVVASVDGSEVVASVGGCAVEGEAVARRYWWFQFIMKTPYGVLRKQFSRPVITHGCLNNVWTKYLLYAQRFHPFCQL